MKNVMLSYSDLGSPIHRLSGATKLIFFLVWATAAMITFDTRVLLTMFLMSIVVFRVSRVKFRDVSFVLYFILFFIIWNHLAIFLFSPLEGTDIYGTRHDLFHIAGPYTVTMEQLFYQFNLTLKYFTVIPIALLFLMTTDPSEFAASLNRIGVSYKVAYAVSIALRYIPDIQRDFQYISFASQARGIDMSKKEKLRKRVKHVVAILIPLIFSSLDRIETISAAMELRQFGREKRRSWYSAKPMKKSDAAVIAAVVVILLASIVLTFHDGTRFYNPF
jgi:energy-coupling factor transport system permease protein